jgi:hypothetical protein
LDPYTRSKAVHLTPTKGTLNSLSELDPLVTIPERFHLHKELVTLGECDREPVLELRAPSIGEGTQLTHPLTDIDVITFTPNANKVKQVVNP